MRPCKTSDALPPLSSSQQVAEEHSRTNQSVQVREVKDADDFKGDVGNNYIIAHSHFKIKQTME